MGESMEGTIRTGIALLDDHIGGFSRGKPYLVFGDAGTGKSLLGVQYLLHGLETGEAGVCLTLERPGDLIAQALSLGLELGPAVERGDIIFLEYDQDVTGRILRYGWKPFLDQLSPLSLERTIRRVVFDPLLPLVAGTIEEGRLRYDLRYFAETLEEWGWTPLLLNERGATQGHPSLYRVLSEICAGIFELQDEVESLESNKYLFIHKLRQSSDKMRKIPFSIVHGTGLVETRGRQPAGTHATPSAAPADSTAPARRKVLLADDDPFVRSLLKKALRDEFEVVMAEDGVEALTLTLRENPDVLVLDVVLPKLTGFEVTRSLRACRFGQPILLVSGIVDPNERLRGLSLGANDYITKPFPLREMVERVRNASRYRMRDSGQAESVDLDSLLRAARSRLLDVEEFRGKLAGACDNVERFGVSMGIVRFAWAADDPEGERLREIGTQIEGLTRPEDLVALLPSAEIVVVLPTESVDGTLAYLRKLRREWSAAVERMPRKASESLRVSFGALEPGGPRLQDPWEAIERVGPPQLPLMRDPRFAPIPGITPASFRSNATGTDA